MLVETGRSCVHPDHRTGAVINLMWAGIARYLHLHGPVAGRLRLGPAGRRRRDGRGGVGAGQRPAPRAAADAGTPAPARGRSCRRRRDAPTPPPLLRGYLRLGAWVCGEPAYDPDFGCADLYVLLSTDRIDPRYRRHFLAGPDQ